MDKNRVKHQAKALRAFLGNVGFAVRCGLHQIGFGARLFLSLLGGLPYALHRFSLVRDQIYFLGVRALSIISISGLFVGFVLGLQGYYTLENYGAVDSMGLLVALSLVRELGPVVSALLFAGCVGTALTAEIGLMKSGEQLLAMEMMAVSPQRYILTPRFWAGIVVMPLLAAVFSAVGILGAWLVGVVLIGVDNASFWGHMQESLDVFHDVGNGVLKSVFFGVVVTFTALLQGYQAKPTPEGVARATTSTVIVSSLTVLGLDFLLTIAMFSI